MNAEHVGRGPLVVDLAGTGTLSASEIGAKAHNLALLARDGFPVPAGLVVTPDAAERWEEARPRLLEAAPDLEAARFAVRSSGTAEAKKQALEARGIQVGTTPTEVAQLVADRVA